MAEPERAFVVEDRNSFIEARVAKLRRIAEARKGSDPYFLARQHAYFLLAYKDCKCDQHSCGGCSITLAVANKLEAELGSMDPLRVDQEEAKACTFWTRKWNELQSFLGVVFQRHERIKQEREARQQSIRPRSLRQDQREDQGS